ncbi:MAG TPA: siphovirus Gp157 family protein [Bryobacteraceae bacterium]|jgi:hypothetical protein|nr:siphovirus Gp157 family protein [Bryobacteraceae bacterium]
MSAAAVAGPQLALVPKRSLFAHVREVEDIADLVDQLDRAGELDPDTAELLSATLCASVAGTKDKIDRSCAVVAAFEAGEAAAAAERERLDARAKRFARLRERLEAYLLAVLVASNLDRIDGNTSSIARRRNPPKIEILDESAIPWEFMRLPDPPPPPAAVPDKSAIKIALKADAACVPGARLMPDNYRLVRS